MALETVEKILFAEKECEKNLTQARESATAEKEKIIIKAEDEAKTIISEAEERARLLVSEAEEKSEAAYNEAKRIALDESEEIKKSVEFLKGKAIDTVYNIIF